MMFFVLAWRIISEFEKIVILLRLVAYEGLLMSFDCNAFVFFGFVAQRVFFIP